MLLTTQQAAKLAGRNRSTIYRACQSGRLSATKDPARGYLIDTAELERVYGVLQPAHGQPEPQPMHTNASANASTLLQLELRHLRDQFDLERNHWEQHRQQHERDRQAWHEERSFLRELIANRDDQIRALTHQPPPETKRAGWWSRLFR